MADRAPAQPASGKSTAIMLGLVLFAVLGGPAIFYGLLAMGEAGLFNNAYENFWLFAGALIAIIVAIWAAMLWLGSRAVSANANNVTGDQLNG